MNWTGDQALTAIKAEVNKRIEAACIVLQNDLKLILDVPAPRKRVRSRRGVIYYRATTPAIAGAPPRKLSGRLQGSITREMDRERMIGRVGPARIPYARRQELDPRYNHKFMEPVLKRQLPTVKRILGIDSSAVVKAAP